MKKFYRKEKMKTYRKTAIIVGILLLVCTATSILWYPFTGSILESPDYLSMLFKSNDMVITGALMEYIWAVTGAGIAIGLYPLLKNFNGALALGSVSLRVVEGVFVLISMLSLLTLLTLSQEFLAAGAPDASSFQTSGSLLLALRDRSFNSIGFLAFALGALMYYVVLYQSRLIPRWLSGWGVLATILSLAAAVLALFSHDFEVGSVHTFLNLPIGVNELVFAVWLIAKGFNPAAVASMTV
jgi:hypothetical protein